MTPERKISESVATRRGVVLRGAALVGGIVAAPLVAACGESGDDATSEVASEAAPVSEPFASTQAAATSTPAESTAGDTTGAAESSAAATTATADAPRFENLGVGLSAPVIGLDPHLTTSSELSAFPCMFEGLYERMPDRSLLPTLAAGPLERVDDTTWRATLVEGRMFTDGSPITAEDVKFSFDRVLNPDLASPYRDYLTFIDSVTVVDPTTIEFKTNLATDIVPERVPLVRVLSQAIVEAKGDKEFAINPEVGSGSMINSEPLGQNSITLKRFEDYSGALPTYADMATFTFIPEPQTAIAQMESGQISIAELIPLGVADSLKDSETINIGISDLASSTQVATAMFNCAKEPFSDQRVRQAFMYAMDRQQLVDIGNLGSAVLADSPLPSAHPYHQTPTVVYDYDPERAKSLLAEAGHPDGFEFELNVSDLPNTKEYAPLLEQQLREAGFKAKLKVAGIDGLFSEVTAGNYQVFVFPHQFEALAYDVDILIRGWWGGFFNESAAFWTTPGAKRVPKALDEALAAPDEDTKKALYAEAQQIIMEEAASCPMIFQPSVQAWRKDITGYDVGFTFKAPITGVQPASA
jgi:peptide/nickel transport system substrate-binding protein